MIKSLLRSLLLMAILPVAFAQTRQLSTLEEARKAAEGVVSAIAADNTAGAMKELRPLSTIPSPDFDVFEAQFNSQQVNLLRQFGVPSGYEFLREDKLGSRLIRYQFLVFHERAPLRWNIVFYRSSKGWVISHFAFDGNALAFFAGGA